MSAKGPKRTRRCPACKSADVKPIMYGYPSAEGMRAAERGEIALGGCLVEASNPVWRCGACAHSWGRLGR